MTDETRNITSEALAREQKESLLAKVLGNPDALTDDEVERFMNDSELREMYNIAVLLKSDAAKHSKKQPRRLHKWAASAIFLISLGAVAMTITFRTILHEPATEQTETAPTELREAAATPARQVSTEKREDSQTEIRLKEDITFENQSLTNIVKQLSDSFGCKISITDTETGALRLYLSLPKGCSVADFVEIIDAYTILNATKEDGEIIITKQEEKQ